MKALYHLRLTEKEYDNLISYWLVGNCIIKFALKTYSGMLSCFVSRNHTLSSKRIGLDSDKNNKAYQQRKEEVRIIADEKLVRVRNTGYIWLRIAIKL